MNFIHKNDKFAFWATFWGVIIIIIIIKHICRAHFRRMPQMR